MGIYEGIAISIYFLIMMGIGYYSYRKSTANVHEFLLGGRQMGPVVTALSAGASDMSGWLLMGLPGAMFALGLSQIWLAVGLITGAYLNYLFVAPRLRVYTEKTDNAITIPDFLEKRFRNNIGTLRWLSASVILVFFTIYTSAGMVSGGKLFESAFELPYIYGVLVTALVVVAYTFLGGFMAVSLTDFVQGTIMVIALLLIPSIVLFDLGGIGKTFDTIKGIDPSYLNLFEGTTTIGILSLLAWGLGYCGQPHIVVRFMAISDVTKLKIARRVGVSWMTFATIGAMFIGLVGIAYMQRHNTSIDDPETIFIYFSKVLFHPLISGFLLSAILAAIMSTISSQLLVSSSSLTEDLYKNLIRKDATPKEQLLVSRLSVLIVALLALLLSLNPKDTILDLVSHAWAGFGSAFGPVILLSLLWKRTTANGAVAGMLAGGITVLLWIGLDHPFQEVYAMIPGFSIALLAIYIVSMLGEEPSKEVQEEFESVSAEWEEKKRL